MNQKKLKKALVLLGILILLMKFYSHDYEYNPQYEITETSDDAFATYSKGKIYIGNKSFLLSILDKIEEGDIIVLDQRNSKNPNMKIITSYTITDKNIRNEILEVLCKYEELYPSSWDRSIESMRLEWLAHNVSYTFHNQRHRTADVDLDNNDEKYYRKSIFNKILKI